MCADTVTPGHCRQTSEATSAGFRFRGFPVSGIMCPEGYRGYAPSPSCETPEHTQLVGLWMATATRLHTILGHRMCRTWNSTTIYQEHTSYLTAETKALQTSCVRLARVALIWDLSRRPEIG